MRRSLKERGHAYALYERASFFAYNFSTETASRQKSIKNRYFTMFAELRRVTGETDATRTEDNWEKRPAYPVTPSTYSPPRLQARKERQAPHDISSNFIVA